MADLISGLSIVQGLGRLIPALLVLFVVYAILSFTQALGKNHFVQAIVALCVAALFLVSAKATSLISFMTPWFVVLFIFIIFILIAFKSMGVSDVQILSAMNNHRSIVIWIISLSALIGVLGLANVYGQGLLGKQPGYEDYTQNPDGTFTSPDGEIIQSIPVSSAQATSGSGTSDFSTNLTRTLFHPKILGFMAMGVIALFSIYFMTRMPRP